MRAAPRWAVLGVVLALALPAYAHAGGRKQKTTRSESFNYEGGSGVSLVAIQGQSCVNGQGCWTLSPRKKEQYIKVDAEDSSGTPTPFQLTVNGTERSYCGTTGDAVWLNGATEANLVVGAVYLPDCQGVATSGTIGITYSNLP